MATADETKKLLSDYRTKGDNAARDQLLDNYVPLVKRVCSRFRGSQEPQDDLVQVGMIGLLNAVEKFDPGYGTAFTSLAIPEILGAVLNYLRDHGSLLKVPRGLRKNKLTVFRRGEELTSWMGRPPTTAELATATDLTEKEVTDAQRFGRMGEPRSLDAPVESLDSDGSCTLADLIGDDDDEMEFSVDTLDLEDAMGALTDREQSILRLRFFKSFSQRQAASVIGISQMHVSRLERAALGKLRSVMVREELAA